jgi:hypothetical protein
LSRDRGKNMAITTTEGLKAAYPVLCGRLEKEARGETTISTVIIIMDGQMWMSTWTEETRDLDEILVGKRIDEYTYYSTGEIDIIIQKKYDSQNELIGSGKEIKHYLDGRQPTVQNLEAGGKGIILKGK